MQQPAVSCEHLHNSYMAQASRATLLPHVLQSESNDLCRHAHMAHCTKRKANLLMLSGATRETDVHETITDASTFLLAQACSDKRYAPSPHQGHQTDQQDSARLRATASCQHSSKTRPQRMLFNKLLCKVLVMIDLLFASSSGVLPHS
jgi:hypothetical protein